MKVRCPRCGNETVYGPENPYRPFCCKRCKESDLFDWLSDDVSSEEETDDEQGDFPGSKPKPFH